MAAGTGCLPQRNFFHLGFTCNWMFLTRTISPGLHNIVPAKRDGVFLWYTNCTSCFSWDPGCMSEPGSRFAWTGRKTSRQNSFDINGTGQIKDTYMHGEIPFNIPSQQTSRPASRIYTAPKSHYIESLSNLLHGRQPKISSGYFSVLNDVSLNRNLYLKQNIQGLFVGVTHGCQKSSR